MKTVRLLCSVFTLCSCSLLQATTRYVDNIITGVNYYKTITAAVAESSSGDTILLTAGQTFTGAGNKNVMLNKNLILGKTGIGTDPIIDMQNDGRFCIIGATFTVTISNLVMINGKVVDNNGGAIRNNGSMAAFSCTFSANTADYGGAIMNVGTITTLEFCTFSANTADYGGAIHSGNTIAALLYCEFGFNTANQYGGAIYNSGNIDFTDSCTFNNNIAVTGEGYGGAIRNTGTTNTLQYCILSYNVASRGGALANTGTIDTLQFCSFNHNAAEKEEEGAIVNTGTIKIIKSCTFDSDVLS